MKKILFTLLLTSLLYIATAQLLLSVVDPYTCSETGCFRSKTTITIVLRDDLFVKHKNHDLTSYIYRMIAKGPHLTLYIA
jgi:hypothetical protein